MLLLPRIVLLGLGLAACRAAEPEPDFRLIDVNPKSVRRAATVSPRDYALQVSGYYFAEAG